MAAAASSSISPRTDQRRFGLRRWQYFEGNAGQNRKCTPGTGHALRKVVAGNVLDHAAAGFEGFTTAGNGLDTKDVVARGTRRQPPRAGQIGRKHAADRAPARFAAQQRTIVHRLEGEPLVAFSEQPFDLGKRRAGLGGEHQFFRLIKRNAGQRRQIEYMRGLHRTTDGAL